MKVVRCILLMLLYYRKLVQSGKSDKRSPDMSRVELKENWRAKHSALSVEVLHLKLTEKRRNEKKTFSY